MRLCFSYHSGPYRKFFALIPHACWVCGVTFWLEWGYQQRQTRVMQCARCHLVNPDQGGA